MGMTILAKGSPAELNRMGILSTEWKQNNILESPQFCSSCTHSIFISKLEAQVVGIHQAFVTLFSSFHTALQVKYLQVLNFEILVEFLFARILSSIEMVCLFSLIMSKKLFDQKNQKKAYSNPFSEFQQSSNCLFSITLL